MVVKWIGAVLILSGSFGTGLAMVHSHRSEIQELKELISALEYMTCELQYNLTPLPALCRQTAKDRKGIIGKVMSDFASELDQQITPDAQACMQSVIANNNIRQRTRFCLEQLALNLGKFDLNGQLKGIESVRALIKRQLDELESNKEIRLRSYQTLSLCAGAALAILLI